MVEMKRLLVLYCDHWLPRLGSTMRKGPCALDGFGASGENIDFMSAYMYMYFIMPPTSIVAGICLRSVSPTPSLEDQVR